MNHKEETFPSILFIVPSDYAQLLKKGVASMILERDEGGFFKKVFSVHPYASKTQTLNLNQIHRLIEFGPDYPIVFLKFRIGHLLNYLLKPVWITKSLIYLIKHEHINIVRATDPFWCGFYARVASRLTGIPFCISIHADYDKNYKLAGKKAGTPVFLKLFERFVLPRADLVMPIREHFGKEIMKMGVDPKKIRLIPHGIAIEHFPFTNKVEMEEKNGMVPEKKVISFVGRLSKENYVYDLIELAKRLSKIRDDFVMILVGDGSERKKLEQLVDEYQLASVVEFKGFQPRDRVILIRRQSYLSLCLRGGFSLIEACIAGCPSISYNVEWHYELVKSGETGFLVNENDVDALTEAATHLLDHPDAAKKMGDKARELAVACHNILKTSEVKRDCYRELLGLKAN